ncbi:hypothetical protein [Phytoactinopolyspora mesophila]|uniref:Uncharacterized protein n=1 Tax=Phytoactinopolyspora mesophila TaxID=2650750 RepID=A0A7K3MAD5_9ACTN|nr:hypothetical protein [Phytoactinopolyspora mesophila]NDL60150.1 hypothetical protein [Phytoactinopolyspora mesophila]
MPGRGSMPPAISVGISTAAVGAALTFTIWWFALRTHNGQLTDWMAFEGLITFLQQNDLRGIETLLGSLRILATLILLLAAALLVIARRHWLVAAQVVAVVVGASATGSLMGQFSPNFFQPQALTSFPFTDSVDLMTVLFASAAVAVIMATRPANRAVVAVLCAGLVGVLTAAQLVSYAQRPSMGIMALLVVTTWTGLVVAGTAIARRRGLNLAAPEGPPASKANTAVGVLVLVLFGLAAGATAVVLMVQWHAGSLPATGRYGYEILSFLGPALAVGATACLTAAANLVTVQAGGHIRPAGGQPAHPAGPDQTDQPGRPDVPAGQQRDHDHRMTETT